MGSVARFGRCLIGSVLLLFGALLPGPAAGEAERARSQPPLAAPASGRLVNADGTAHALELRCGDQLFRSEIAGGATGLLAPPAQTGCVLTVVTTGATLAFTGGPQDVRIEGGTPRATAAALVWTPVVKVWGGDDQWPPSAVRQWPAEARASSEYSPAGWSAAQATGAPDTFGCGDISTAWTTRAAQATEPHWIELRYPKKVRAVGARLHVTNAPGAVAGILGRKGSGFEPLWRGPDPTASCPAVLVARFIEEIDTDTIRVVLDLSKQTSWFELDTVELVGLAK